MRFKTLETNGDQRPVVQGVAESIVLAESQEEDVGNQCMKIQQLPCAAFSGASKTSEKQPVSADIQRLRDRYSHISRIESMEVFQTIY